MVVDARYVVVGVPIALIVMFGVVMSIMSGNVWMMKFLIGGFIGSLMIVPFMWVAARSQA